MIKSVFRFLTIGCLLCAPFYAEARYNNDLMVCVHSQWEDETGVHQIKGLTVTLTNHRNKRTNEYPTAITGENGCAIFEDGCRGIQRKTKQFMISDPNRVYSTVVRTIEAQAKECNGYFSVPKADPDYVALNYLDPETVRNYARDINNQLEFYKVCQNLKKKNYLPPKVLGLCFTNFENTQVQINQGVELAQLLYQNWADTQPDISVNSQLIQCNIGAVDVYRRHDYLQCTSLDGKVALEFKFRDLFEGDPKTVQIDTAAQLCSLYDFASSSTRRGDNNDVQASCYRLGVALKPTDCNPLKTTVNSSFPGWNIDYRTPGDEGNFIETQTNPYSKYFKVPQRCEFSFGLIHSEGSLKTYPGLDSRKFEHLTVYSDDELFNIINQYVDSQLLSYKGIECSHGLSLLKHSNLFLDDYEHVVHCVITDIGNTSHPVDFVFKSVTAKNDFRNNAGQAGAQCLAQNGLFDGRDCIGIGKMQCLALDNVVAGGTKWENNICKMPASENLDTHQTIVDKLITGFNVSFWIVTAALTTYETGGAAAFAYTTVAVASAADVISDILDEVQKGKARDFVHSVAICPDAQECDASGKNCKVNCGASQCAKNVLLNSYADIKSLIPKPGEQASSQLTKALGEAYNLLLAKIGDQCIDEQFVEQYLNANSELAEAKFWVDTVGSIAYMMQFGRGGYSSIRNIGDKSVPVLAKMCRIARNTFNMHMLMQKKVEQITNSDLPTIDLDDSVGEIGLKGVDLDVNVNNVYGIFKKLVELKLIKC